MQQNLEQQQIDHISIEVRSLKNNRSRSKAIESALFMSSVFAIAMTTFSACSFDVACDGGVCLSEGQADITCSDSAQNEIEASDHLEMQPQTLTENLPSDDVDWYAFNARAIDGRKIPQVTLAQHRKDTRIYIAWNHQLLNHDKSYQTTCPKGCLLYTSPSARDATLSRMPSSA